MNSQIKTSPQKAIALFCKGCIYDPLAGGTHLAQIERCQITDCELYLQRPLTAKTRQIRYENYLATLSPDDKAIELELAAQRRAKMAGLRNKAVLL